MKRLLSSARGETLVEVMCAGTLLLMALGVLLGAVRFSSAAERHTMEVRRWTAELSQSLGPEPSGTGTDRTAVYAFTAVPADGTPGDGEALFTVTAALTEAEGVYKTADGREETVTFRLFAPPEGEP